MLKIIARSGTVIQQTSTSMANKEFNFTGMETLSLNPGVFIDYVIDLQ